MKDARSGDINFYGATNDAEFFAVITEYFFEKPEELKHRHPELFDLLEHMFHPGEGK
jgi:Mlc titration factor MtfA (ptsG expression regulator)